MKFVRYIVKIPTEEKNTYTEFIFDNQKDLCEKLNISITSLYSLIQGTFKATHSKTQHLEGVIIERHPVYCEKTLTALQNKEKKEKLKEENLQKKNESKLMKEQIKQHVKEQIKEQKALQKLQEEENKKNEINRKRNELLSNLKIIASN